MSKYMKGQFPFCGIKTLLRRALHKHAVTLHRDEVKQQPREIALALFERAEREYHYSAIEILIKELDRNFVLEDIVLIEYLLATHSWWDSVDTISKFLLGGYLRQYPQETNNIVGRFSSSHNMWLNRATILFQLGYKTSTDSELLFSQCLKHKGSKEFFIQKAIGWALREYAKSHPDAVKKFVARAHLKPLSTREALKNL